MNDIEFLKKRHRSNNQLKFLGIIAVSISCLFLVIIFGSIAIQASSAFKSYAVKVEAPSNINSKEEARAFLIQYVGPQENYLKLFSMEAEENIINKKPWIIASSKLNDILSGHTDLENIKPSTLKLVQKWKDESLIEKQFNFSFFTGKESRDPEKAGILTSLVGTVYTILICALVAIPIALCAAIYLEEFAPKNLLTSFIEININNLAAVPSIVFGLLALAVLINMLGLPRSAPITAGITLAMISLPTLVITARQAFKNVPSNIKQAALALGATKIQIIFHHTLPLALPGIATGVILSMARAIGETAPFILIGMVAFIVDIPQDIFEPATVIPVQIYLWSSSPEYAFKAKTALAILFLLTILILINMIAVYIRKKYENRW